MSEPTPVLLVTVVRSGGVAGLRREWTVQASTDEEASRWWPLVQACPWDEPCPDDPGARDTYVYELHANDLSARVPEQHLDGPWRDLTEAVRSRAATDT